MYSLMDSLGLNGRNHGLIKIFNETPGEHKQRIDYESKRIREGVEILRNRKADMAMVNMLMMAGVSKSRSREQVNRVFHSITYEEGKPQTDLTTKQILDARKIMMGGTLLTESETLQKSINGLQRSGSKTVRVSSNLKDAVDRFRQSASKLVGNINSKLIVDTSLNDYEFKECNGD